MGINIVDLMTSIIPGGGTIDVFIKEWRENKLKESKYIYLSEVREGIFDNIDKDDVISIAYRLWRAVSEGTSKNNFRLICRLIQGLGNKKALNTSTFLKFTSVLDSLTDDEIKVISLDIWLYKNPKPKNISTQRKEKKEQVTFIYFDESKEYQEWKEKTSHFIQTLDLSVDFNKYFDQLSTNGRYVRSFPDPFLTIHYSLLRTGLYSLEIKTTQKSESGDGVANSIFNFSPLMQELMEYVDFYITHK